MTVADIELDMDLMEELDSLSAIPCDIVQRCGLEAQWYDVLACCGADTLLLCQEHQDALEAVLKKVPEIICGVCQTVLPSDKAIAIVDRL